MSRQKIKKNKQTSFWSVQFSRSVVSDSLTSWTATRQASLSFTHSQSLLKLMSIELVMPSNHLILCRPLLLPPSIFPRIRVFDDESALRIRWPKYWSFSFSIIPSNDVQSSLILSSVHGLLQPRILEWVAIFLSKGFSQPRNQTWVSCIAGRLFTDWVTRDTYSIQQQWTISWLACDMWWKVVYIWNPAMTSSVAGPRSSSRAQAKFAPQRSWSLFGDLLPIWSTTAFWILAKPLHLRGMLGKSMRCTQMQHLQPAPIRMSPVLLHNAQPRII